jgi:hypothetical protein
MAREYGKEYPERTLMSTISSLLGIPHFTTANGSTVRRDFLEAAAAAMGIDGRSLSNKDHVLKAVWEHATGRQMPEDRYSNGATVTNKVLQEIVDGILRRLTGAVPATPDIDMELHDDVAQTFDPAALDDERSRQVREVAVREGRDRFRTAVLEAYGSCCAITITDVPAALDAAHIAPFKGRQSNVIPNGICLRKDIHSLFDRGMLAVDEHTHQVLLAGLGD